MQNQQQSQYQPIYNQISSLEYKGPTNNNKEQYHDPFTPSSPILPHSYPNDSQQQLFFNKGARPPEIMFNDQGQPMSTLDYIKSQKDIENLDFINTLIRLKSSNNNYDSSSLLDDRPIQEPYQHTKTNQIQVQSNTFDYHKESNILPVTIDDSKISLKEILDIYDEYDDKTMNKKTKGLKRNDLIEITNRRKKMAESEPMKEVAKMEIVLEENKEVGMGEQGDEGVEVVKNSSPLKKEENINITHGNSSNKKGISAVSGIEKKNKTKPPSIDKNNNTNNRTNEANYKQFNNQKNIQLIGDMLRETKQIEAGMIKRQERRDTSNSNHNSALLTEGSTKKISMIKNPPHKTKHNNSMANKSKPKDKETLIKPKEDQGIPQVNKDKPKTLEFKPKHNKSTSLHTKDQIQSEYPNNLPLTSLIIESNTQPKPLQSLNILKASTDNPIMDPSPIKTPQASQDDMPISPIVKAEIDLFDDDNDNTNTYPKTTQKPVSNTDKAKNKVLMNSIQPIKENQIEFDIDELLHPKYLFKSANDSINYINKTNSNKKTSQEATNQKPKKRNCQSINTIQKLPASSDKSKDSKKMGGQLNKTNTAKHLPAYNQSYNTNTTNTNSSSTQGKTISTPSKLIQIISKTPTSNKYKFEPKKSKELMFTEGEVSSNKPFSQRIIKDLSKSNCNSKKTISITNLTFSNDKTTIKESKISQIASLLTSNDKLPINNPQTTKNIASDNNNYHTLQSKSQTKLH